MILVILSASTVAWGRLKQLVSGTMGQLGPLYESTSNQAPGQIGPRRPTTASLRNIETVPYIDI